MQILQRLDYGLMDRVLRVLGVFDITVRYPIEPVAVAVNLRDKLRRCGIHLIIPSGYRIYLSITPAASPPSLTQTIRHRPDCFITALSSLRASSGI